MDSLLGKARSQLLCCILGDDDLEDVSNAVFNFSRAFTRAQKVKREKVVVRLSGELKNVVMSSVE